MNESITRKDCLLETIMVSNGNEDGLELQASEVIGEVLGERAVEGSAVVVDCERCDTRFAIARPLDSITPVIFRSENKCDRPAGAGLSRNPGEWALNLNVIKVRERGDL